MDEHAQIPPNATNAGPFRSFRATDPELLSDEYLSRLRDVRCALDRAEGDVWRRVIEIAMGGRA